MATPLLVLRTDQSAALKAPSFQSLANAARAFYRELQEHKMLMRSAFNDDDPQNIDWTQLQTLWGAPEGVSGKMFWDMINGTLILLDSGGGNNDFQSLIKRVV